MSAHRTGNQPVLRVEGLTKVFGVGRTEVRAVNGVTFEAHAGEILLIMGPSGSGKTTLLTMLGALLRPSSGHVWLNGRDLAALPERERAKVRQRDVGFIFQTFNLLEALSPLENVELALNVGGVRGEEARERARSLLSAVGLEGRLDFRTRDLSGGEKQRVSIARALVHEPLLILADEPTANLDSKHGREVMLLLRRLAKDENRAVVIVSHDHRLREIADRVMWMEDGALEDFGRLAADPVCGMAVEVERSPSWVHDGTTYHFCSDGCLAQFRSSPARFHGRRRRWSRPRDVSLRATPVDKGTHLG